MTKSEDRFQHFDIARSIAAFAVVIHHISQYFPRYGVGTFDAKFGSALVVIVSYLHIPTFMLISGMLISQSKSRVDTIRGYFAFERKKFSRLMLPFISISILHLAVKTVIPAEALSSGMSAVIKMLIAPRGAAAGHLWFLYCLMSIFIIWPIVHKLMSGSRAKIYLSVLFIIAILPVDWPKTSSGQPIAGLENLFWYLPIFTMGYCYQKRFRDNYFYSWKVILISTILFTASILIRFLVSWPEEFVWQSAGRAIRMIGFVSGGLCILGLSRVIFHYFKRSTSILSKVGKRSYDIYLLHVALVGHPLCYVASKLDFGTTMTCIAFVGVVLVTMIIPIGIGWVIRRIPLLAFIMLGVPMPETNMIQES